MKKLSGVDGIPTATLNDISYETDFDFEHGKMNLK